MTPQWDPHRAPSRGRPRAGGAGGLVSGVGSQWTPPDPRGAARAQAVQAASPASRVGSHGAPPPLRASGRCAQAVQAASPRWLPPTLSALEKVLRGAYPTMAERNLCVQTWRSVQGDLRQRDHPRRGCSGNDTRQRRRGRPDRDTRRGRRIEDARCGRRRAVAAAGRHARALPLSAGGGRPTTSTRRLGAWPSGAALAPSAAASSADVWAVMRRRTCVRACVRMYKNFCAQDEPVYRVYFTCFPFRVCVSLSERGESDSKSTAHRHRHTRGRAQHSLTQP